MSETLEGIIFRNINFALGSNFWSFSFVGDVSTSTSTRIAYAEYFWWMHTCLPSGPAYSSLGVLWIISTRGNRTTRRFLPPIEQSNKLGTLLFSGADKVYRRPTCP